MFTLGNKEIIVNGPSQYSMIADADKLDIKGFGEFHKDQIVSAAGNRFQAGTVSTLAVTCPAATDLGIASGILEAVVVNIYMTTSRHSSEWANDFISKGKPYVFELILNGDDTSTVVATKLAALMTAYNDMFPGSDRGLPFTFAAAAAVVTLTGKDDFTTFKEYVSFTIPDSASVAVASTVRVVNTEATTTGAYLEENVTISNSVNSLAYSNRNGQVPVIGVDYTQITFVMKSDNANGIGGVGGWRRHKNLGISMADAGIGENEFTYTLYFNEDTTLSTGGQVDMLMTFLLTGAPVLGDFILADGVTPATIDASTFIA